MRKLLLTALALMVVGLVASPVLAQRWAGTPGHGWYAPADQTTINLRQELWQKQRALYDELAQAKPDAAKVRTLTARVNTLRQKLFSRTTRYTARRGGWGGYHMGYGMGPGYGMGYGGCWR